MSQPYQICFLGYGRLTDLGRSVVEQFHWTDTEVLITDCNVDSLVQCVNDAVEKGYEIFVGGAANAAEFFRRARGRLVEIRIRDTDYLLAIQKALRLGKRPAVAVYRHSNIPNFKLYSQLMGIELEVLAYEDGFELYNMIEHSNCDVIIGASHANEVAQALNKVGILLYPGKESVAEALRRARNMAMELRKEQRNQAVIRAVLNNSTFGLVVSNDQNRIIMFNRAAQTLTGIPAAEARGRLMSEVFPMLGSEKFLMDTRFKLDDYHLIYDTMFRCIQTKITLQNETIGVLTTLNADTRSRRSKEAAVPNYNIARTTFADLTSRSEAMAQLIDTARLYADAPSPVMVVGPEGSGREELLQCIHNASPRQEGPYVRIDLAAIGGNDAGRILLGYEESNRVSEGLLELANRGSVVLENLSCAAPQALKCIMSVLSSRRIMRLGRAEPLPVDVRFLSYMTPEERQALSPGLGYKLGVLCLSMPPLWHRREDIPELFGQLTKKYVESRQKKAELTHQQAELLTAYQWPGNIHELSAVSQRYMYTVNQEIRPNAATKYRLLLDAIGEDNLFWDLMGQLPSAEKLETIDRDSFRQKIERVKQLLHYNNSSIGEKLGMSRTSLWRLLKGQ